MKTMLRRAGFRLVRPFLVAICLLACQEERISLPALVTVPAPLDLAQLDPPVRDQYLSRRSAVDARLTASKVDRHSLAAAFGELAMWAHLYDDLEIAAISYRNARTLAPREFRWAYYLAHVYRLQGDLMAAVDTFQAALRLEPNDVASRVWAGEIELERGNVAAAATLFRAALDDQPGCLRARVGLGRVALVEGEPRAALEWLEPELDRQSQAGQIQYLVGLAYRDLGDLERARSHLRRGETDPVLRRPLILDDPLLQALEGLRRDARSYLDQGERALGDGRFGDAVEAFRQAVTADTEDVESRLGLALALLRNQQLAEAGAELDEILDRRPGHARARFGRANLRTLVNDLAGAEADYRAALASDPFYMEAHFNLGNLLRRGGRHEQALSHFERVIELDPANARARQRRASELLRLARWRQARATLTADLEQLPGSPDLSLLLARLLATAPQASLRNGQQALELGRQLFAKQANVLNAETVAMAHAELGDFASALAWQRAVLAAVSASADGGAPAWIGERLADYELGRPMRSVWSRGERPLATTVIAPVETVP